MQHNISFIFNSVAGIPAPSKGLTLAIRTDARHATATLKKNLIDHLARQAAPLKDGASMEKEVDQIVHDVYRKWGHEVLEILADCLDYSRYGISDSNDQEITVHFYNARELAERAVRNSENLLDQADRDQELPLVYISLDDMIEEQSEYWSEIGFSRLFGLEGDQQGSYLARPGKKPLEEQVKEVCRLLENLKSRYNANIPFVLLEDNVRHARMLNWVIELMEKHHIFEHGRLAGISTCFCCASADERAKIQHDGKPVPVLAVIDYKDALVDVITPRDLLFDGLVVQIGEKITRLPGIFMNVKKLFKIDPEKAEEFTERTKWANVRFCHEIQERLGVPVPLSWFTGADAISHVTGATPDESMSKVLKSGGKVSPNDRIDPR